MVCQQNLTREKFFLKNYVPKMVKRLFPDPFLRSQNWPYLWINGIKFSAVCFYCMSSWGFCKKRVLRNVAKIAGKHLIASLFFNKVPGLRPAPLLKKRLSYRCFSVNFVKFLRTPFLQITSGRLLLNAEDCCSRQSDEYWSFKF